MSTFLLYDPENIIEKGNDSRLFIERILKGRKKSRQYENHKYESKIYLLPTSNICGRMFSKVDYLLSYRRKAMTPTNMEAHLFLLMIRDMLAVSDISTLTQKH